MTYNILQVLHKFSIILSISINLPIAQEKKPSKKEREEGDYFVVGRIISGMQCDR